MADRGTIRAFLAMDPPPEVLQRIADIQEVLKKTLRGSISWVRPGGIHLTLKFFGDIAAEGLQPISEVVSGQAAGTRPLHLNIKGLGVFPGIRRPRILWLGVGGEVARLTALQGVLDQGFETCGIKQEERPFRAHLTLARIKSPQGLSGLDKVLEEKEAESAGPFEAKGLILFKSDLTPKGAIYTVLADFPFQGS
ncbi:MAG: RNA 2',3'-cyclic phosphodiesterase [Deltaproteobacteria bacterium]|nr:RNA 2',3'-cyclic phosphodiesterase [Deltaproteobacteria bacterium]